MFKKADTQLIKLLNEIQILNLIRNEGPIARIEVARRVQMSKVAVFDIINRLVEAGFVIDVGKGESTSRGGKRPSLVKLNPENHYVIGIVFKRREIQIALANIEAELLNFTKFKMRVGSLPGDVLDKIFAKIERLLKDSGINAEQIISIGIGSPGLIDYEKGKLRFADTLRGWDDVSLVEIFSQRYNVPVFIENDVKVISLAESILGAGKEKSNIVCVWVGEGVGAGLIINNQLLQGHSGGAGEIGYLELDRFCELAQRLPNLYKGQKYIGDILSDAYLEEVILSRLSGRGDLKRMNFPRILKSKSFFPEIKDILDEFAYLLGMACSTLIKVINPELLILSGRVVEHSDYLFQKVADQIQARAGEVPFFSTEIVKGALGERASLRGAIVMALQVIFETRTAASKHKF
ncbi:ROK family transcriptional regulator [Calditrichota bacterium GD2]